jgi:hypothetical protein
MSVEFREWWAFQLSALYLAEDPFLDEIRPLIEEILCEHVDKDACLSADYVPKGPYLQLMYDVGEQAIHATRRNYEDYKGTEKEEIFEYRFHLAAQSVRYLIAQVNQ